MTEKNSSSSSAEVTTEMCQEIIAEQYSFQGSKVTKLDGYDDYNFHLISPVPIDSNAIVDIWPAGYTLKIINWESSENSSFIGEYINVLLYLNEKNIPCPRPVKNRTGEYYGYWINPRESKSGRRHIVIMLTYLDGEELQAYRCDDKITFALGQLMSKLHRELEPFHSSKAFRRPEFSWTLEAVPSLRNLLNEIKMSEERKDRAQKVINEFQDDVLSKLVDLEKGVIHNDLNDRNLLVKRLADGASIEFVGVIDFSDMVYTAYLFEIAITACYLCLNNPDEQPVKLVASLIAGYDRRSLTNTEYRLLKMCMCARLVQSLVMGLHVYSLNPNHEYVLATQKEGWRLLYAFYEMKNEHFVDEIRGQLLLVEENKVT